MFSGLEAAPALLLAVSGGPDSMALMLLVARWAQSLAAAPALHVATVDHGLRPASAAEAALAAAAAARLGLPHATLRWIGEKPATRIQERARAARYALLAAHAERIGAAKILTAHHADDQAETVLMRLVRGSGIGGLAGMRRETRLSPGITLVRPLLDVPKAELVALCHAGGIEIVDDPSNRDPAYARVRLRGEAAALARLGLDHTALLRLARRAARAEDALEAEAARAEVACNPRRSGAAQPNPEPRSGATALRGVLVQSLGSGISPSACPGTTESAGTGLAPSVEMSLDAHRSIAPEILLRLVRRAVERLAPAPLRLERLETLTEVLGRALREGRPHRATLGRARVVLAADGTLSIVPAPPRRRGLARTAGGRPRLRPYRRASCTLLAMLSAGLTFVDVREAS